MKKRGQITIFIVLGIILLLIIGLLIVLQQQKIIFTPEQIYPPDIMPLKNFAESCITDVAIEAITLIGINGGYITFPPEIANDPLSYISTNPIFEDDIKLPLWSYEGQLRIPSEAEMIKDIEDYIAENSEPCFTEMIETQQSFDITELKEINPIVTLTDFSVEIKLDYPLEFSSKIKNQTTTIPEFTTSVPVRLKTVYNLAKTIMEKEEEQQFLEEITMELIILDPDIPFTDMEFSCRPNKWYVRDVEAKLELLLRSNLPLIRIDKTAYEPVLPEREYVKNHFIWTVTDRKYPTTRASISYDEKYPMQLYIRPNKGGVLESNAQRGTEQMQALCMQIWHFTYDIKYPVTVTIVDEAAKDYEEYNFNFAFMVGIKSNRADRTAFGMSGFDFEQTPEAERFCRESPSNELTVRTFENVSSAQGEFYKEIDEVNITFTCIRYTCEMGQSKTQSFGAIKALIAYFPYCPNGVLRGLKPNYLTAQTFVTPGPDALSESLFLRPIKKMNYTVVKHFKNALDEEREIEEAESAVITLKGNGVSSNGMYPAQGDVQPLTLLTKADFSYELLIYLTEDRADKTYFIGGYKGNWSVSQSELDQADEIKFHVYEWPFTAFDEDQFKRIANLSEFSKSVPKPELK